MFKRAVVLFIVWLNFVVLLPAQAQGGCASARIEDQTGQLDVSAVCSATAQWSFKGYSVYILLTDEQFDNEDEWYAYLDARETAINEREGNLVSQDFLAFEATADGEWATITMGDFAFYNTPLGGQKEQIRNVLSNGLQIDSDEPATAFVNAINQGYNVAFPPPPPVVVATTRPVESESSSTSSETSADDDNGNVAGAFGRMLLVFVVFGIVGAAGYFLGVPAWRSGYAWYKQVVHLRNVHSSVIKHLNAVSQLLPGENVEGTLLYQLLNSYGIKHNEDGDEETRASLNSCQQALNEALIAVRTINKQYTGWNKFRTVQKQIHLWETVAVTIFGNNPEVLGMTDKQLAQLLDPSGGMEKDQEVAPLVKQLAELNRQLSGGGLKITFTQVDPQAMDQQGILGYVLEAKDILTELRNAKLNAQPAVIGAKENRADLAQQPFQQNSTEE